MNSLPILAVDKLSKAFSQAHSNLTVLADITFSLPPKGTCAIVGPSGSGKTTLLGLCAGLDRPSSGSVRLDAQLLESLSEDELARLRSEKIGFVFQNFQLIPTLTALENVMVPVELRGERDARTRATELLEMVGLAERLMHYPVQLSGGEQQRVALARAFVNRPKVLFADEPTGNLDGETGSRVIQTLFEMNKTHGTALVLVTHDDQLAQGAEQIIRLRNGRMVRSPDRSNREWPVTL
jgi:putative ABC transport system ATP-binding protein